MSDLAELQHRIANLIMQPLTRADGMRSRTSNGRPVNAEAQALIKPNRVLTSFERLEIYNRQYWFRVLSSFAEDFPGLRAVVGAAKFERLMRAYLNDCPSKSFTLRNLGSQLELWLRLNPKWIEGREVLARNLVFHTWRAGDRRGRRDIHLGPEELQQITFDAAKFRHNRGLGQANRTGDISRLHIRCIKEQGQGAPTSRHRLEPGIDLGRRQFL